MPMVVLVVIAGTYRPLSETAVTADQIARALTWAAGLYSQQPS